MLQRIESEICQVRRFLVPVDSEDGALVVKLIGIDDGKFLAHSQPLFLAQLLFERMGPAVRHLINGQIDAATVAMPALLDLNDQSPSPHSTDMGGGNASLCRTTQQ